MSEQQPEPEKRAMRDISATSGAEGPGAGDEPSGFVGNERLTALTGVVVLVLSVAEVATVPTLGSLMAAHAVQLAYMRYPGWRWAWTSPKGPSSMSWRRR
ncbi:hypothetical protein [Arthrobacter sp. FW306-04-A]|uniref:hypothetical protein n=1 Tax=Arthrobacter sp. FW306-04-A TaxID=2879619 RepID=UPI0037C0E2BE|nr:hypothetical protein LFT43_09410 [Arthrobacter sp. FW306-04-A]